MRKELHHMNTPKFKANDFVRITYPEGVSFIGETNVLAADESLYGLVGVIRATFKYDTQVNDYDVAIIGRKYKSHHQHEAIDERFLAPYAQDVSSAA
jgi:hypothetical protein